VGALLRHVALSFGLLRFSAQGGTSKPMLLLHGTKAPVGGHNEQAHVMYYDAELQHHLAPYPSTAAGLRPRRRQLTPPKVPEACPA